MKNKIDSIPTTYLASDYSISRILKGGWQLAGGHGRIDTEQAIMDMFAFVENGITAFDCADIYTGVEELIGMFRKKYAELFGQAELEKIKIHTKFVPDLDILPHIKKVDVEKIIDRSLQRLHMERVDLVQFHWWDYDIPGYVETANYLKEIKEAGKIKYIGATNFDVPHLKEIMDSGVSIISHQVQYSLLDHRPENGMTNFCNDHDIKLLCYGTVAGGFLSRQYLGVEEPDDPLPNRSLVKYKLIIDDFGGWDLFQQLLHILDRIAKKYNVSITNIATRYVLERQQVAGIIIGALDISHLHDNALSFSFQLDTDDYNMIHTVLTQTKGPKGDTYGLERIKNGKHASIMKYNLNKPAAH